VLSMEGVTIVQHRLCAGVLEKIGNGALPLLLVDDNQKGKMVQELGCV